MKNKKVLITTIPQEAITLCVRYGRSELKTDTIEEIFNTASSIEYINGMTMPNYATQFLKANIPSIDILEYPTWDEYKQALKNNYDIIGISFWIYTSEDAIRMANLAREAGVKEVWGGGHGASTPGIEKYFDRIFTSYSEYELKPIIEGEELKQIRHPVLITKADHQFGDMNIGYLFSLRGCKYNCTYCTASHYYKRLDITPIEEIERILDIYVENDISQVSVVDHTFMLDKEHSKKVLNALKERNLQWSCTSRVNLLSGRIEELKSLGLTSVYFGMESMNNLSLKSVKKGQTPNQTVALLNELQSNGLYATCTYMICFDNDTPESVKEDIKKLNYFESLYTIMFYVATPFPGTKYWEQSVKEEKIIDWNWKNYDAKHLVRKHPTIAPDEARELLKYCVKNHCHKWDRRKYKLIKKWEKLEKESVLSLK